MSHLLALGLVSRIGKGESFDSLLGLTAGGRESREGLKTLGLVCCIGLTMAGLMSRTGLRAAGLDSRGLAAPTFESRLGLIMAGLTSREGLVVINLLS